MNKLSLWLNCRTLRVDVFRSSYFLFFHGERAVFCGTRSSGSSRSTSCPRIQAADGQEVLPAAEHVALEIPPAAAQVPQQAMEQVQQGELGVEYVYFCRLCVFL